jgi:hypothetical protein
MNCELVQRRLLSSNAPDRPSAELRQHLDECPSCRAWHEQLTQVERQLPLLPIPPSSRKANVVRHLLGATEPVSTNGSTGTFTSILPFTQPSPRERGLRKASLAIAMAAGLAVFALGWWAWQKQPPPAPPPLSPLVGLRDDLDQRLRQARTKPEKLDVVAKLADHHHREALTLAQRGDADQLAYTAQFYTELVRNHLPRYAKEMTPAERQEVLPGIADQLEKTNSSIYTFLGSSPTLSAKTRDNLKQMADEARDSQLQVQAILRGEV